MFENSEIGMFHFDQNGTITCCNDNFLDIIGSTKREIIGSNVLVSIRDEKMKAAVEATLSGRSVHYEGEYLSVLNDKLIPIKVDLEPEITENGSLLGGIGIVEDITGLKMEKETLLLDESRLEGLLKLNQMMDASMLEITDFAREEGVRLTRSKVGYLSFLNEDETVLTMHSWSKVAMEGCKIRDKPIEYPLETTGLWGEAVRQRKPIITNNYQEANPLKKGYPRGHVKLTRHMNVPVFDGDRIVAVAGVGNKEEEYDESDVRQLTLLMQGMWSHIQRKLAADSLKEYSNELSRINTELTRANEELKSLDKMKDDIISNVSHELKTPLVSIIGYSELVNEGTLGGVND
nr:GAF domain-containing protein [Methanohalophilus mahii]